MRNYWLVAKHEYRRTVVRRGFLIGTLAIPVAIAALIALVIVVESMGADDRPIGYVDHAGLLEETRAPAESNVEIRAYTDREAATAALEAEEIQAFYELPADYLTTLETELTYLADEPDGDARGAFRDFVRLNLVASYPAEVQARLLSGPEITVEDVASRRTFGEDEIANIALPIMASIFFMVATMSAGGYMLRVVSDEKENRTMELMITSITPGQLVGGKALGLLAAALTQLSIYLVAAAIGLLIVAVRTPELQQLSMPWDYLAVMALFFFPAYALLAALMVAVGSAVTEFQQGQQVAAILNLLFLIPLFLLPFFFSDPGRPLVVLLTVFPPTAFMTVSLRWGLGTIPLWQLVLSWTLLSGTALFTIWAAARIFRVGMLRYGKALTLNGALVAVRGK
jgi:ABC-2 type transport system permease protein